MEGEIKAGVVVVTRFCKAASSAFSEYINYIDRDEAARNDMLSEYNLYNDYMDNPEKTTGLFTKSKTNLTMKEKQDLKQIFITAQKNGSLMWQTVISFDNRWLEKHGLYDSKKQIVDERKLKEIATGAVNKMLKNEGLENAVWSAAIHFNTDNLHIHIATVEPNPMREMKEYQVYREEAINGKKENISLRDANGELVKTKEYVGRFKGRSIELCKKHMVDEIMGQREQNIDINKFIREQVVKQKKDHILSKDADLKDKFLNIYKCLPRTGNRGLWNYNNNAMKKIRPMLDNLSEAYIDKYHAKEYKEFLETLTKQSENYKTAYGKNSKRDFKEGKIKELHERLGNQILKEMREYDIRTEGEEWNPDDVDNIMESFFEEKKEIVTLEEVEDDFYIDLDELNIADSIMDWTKEFKEARALLYGIDKNFERGLSIMAEEAENGNVLAIFELGNLYKHGVGVDIDLDKADYYFSKSLDIFKYLHENAVDEKFMNIHGTKEDKKKPYSKVYLEYRIGKQYYYGLGTDQSYEKAFAYLKESADNGNIYAAYTVGNMYYNGEYVEKDKKAAIHYYKVASVTSNIRSALSEEKEHSIKKRIKGNAYADFKLGQIYGADKNMEKAQEYYSVAYNTFYEMEKSDADDNLEYKLGMMNLKGLGIEADQEEAEKYLKMSAGNGNVNAQYQYAKILLERGEEKDVKRALRMLKRAADKNSQPAQYALGKFYAVNEDLRDDSKAIKYLRLASEKNAYAKYHLGKVYEREDSAFYDMDKAMENFVSVADEGISFVQYKVAKIYADKDSGYYDMDKAIHYFTCVAKDGNEFAQYKLGNIYANKEGGYYDIQKAVEYLTRVADKGNEYAQYKLGRLYIDEKSGIYNPLKAIEYYGLANDQGNEFASLALGFIFLNGTGVPSDKVQARYYFDKASQAGNEVGQKMVKHIDNPYKPRKRLRHPIPVRNRGAYEIERALKTLEYAFESTLEKARIIRMHEQLLEQERREKDRDEKELNYEETDY